MTPLARKRAAFGAVGAALVVLGAAAFLPIRSDSREQVFDIPQGTWARRMAGEKLELLPSEIHLVLDLRDVLVLKNSDDVPHMFGPTLLMPGQTLRLPFSVPSENHFSCTAHANGQLLVIVEEAPTTPWARVAWRVRSITR